MIVPIRSWALRTSSKVSGSPVSSASSRYPRATDSGLRRSWETTLAKSVSRSFSVCSSVTCWSIVRIRRRGRTTSTATAAMARDGQQVLYDLVEVFKGTSGEVAAFLIARRVENVVESLDDDVPLPENLSRHL